MKLAGRPSKKKCVALLRIRQKKVVSFVHTSPNGRRVDDLFPGHADIFVLYYLNKIEPIRSAPQL